MNCLNWIRFELQHSECSSINTPAVLSLYTTCFPCLCYTSFPVLLLLAFCSDRPGDSFLWCVSLPDRLSSFKTLCNLCLNGKKKYWGSRSRHPFDFPFFSWYKIQGCSTSIRCSKFVHVKKLQGRFWSPVAVIYFARCATTQLRKPYVSLALHQEIKPFHFFSLGEPKTTENWNFKTRIKIIIQQAV